MDYNENQSSTSNVPDEYREHVREGTNWRDIVKWVGDLPPLPHVAASALSLIEDPATSAGKLTDLLGKDTALAARVLKIANSAMFAKQREITTISQAIMLIGFKPLKGIIIAASLRQLNRKPSDAERLIWENSTCVATACQLLARKLKKPFDDEAFVLGLLHDLGKLVLVRQIAKEYAEIVAEAHRNTEEYFVVEERHLGCSHALVGALVAKKWNFAADTCQVILHHHDPITISSTMNEIEQKQAIVFTADLIAHHLGSGHQEGYPDLTEKARASATAFGLSTEEFDALVELIKEKNAASSGAFQ